MLQSTRAWLRRNRTNFAIGAGIVGTAYLAGQYALSKFSEARVRMSEERVAKENLRRRFEQNQEDCSFTVLAILPTATDKIVEAVPVEAVLEELQKQKARRLMRSVGPSEIASSAPPSVVEGGDEGAPSTQADSESFVHASQVGLDEGSSSVAGSEAGPEGKASRKSKAQLWNEMKISSITRAFTLLYTISLLTLLTRIQLNLLGRRNYLASVVSLASPPPADASSRINLENNDDDNFEQAYGNDFETNRRYLSLSWWLLHRGSVELIAKVRDAVQDVFGLLNPREEITIERLSELTLEVRKRIEGATEQERRTRKWLPYLLPPPDLESFVLSSSGMPPLSPSSSPTTLSSLRRLIDETSDIADSPAFTSVLTRLLDAAFSHLIDVKISQLAYKIPPVSASTARVTEIIGDGVKAKVAVSLAVFCRQAHAIGAGANNEYLEKMEQVGELEAFAAVVYSSNFEFESPALAAETVATGGEGGLVGDVEAEAQRRKSELLELKDEVAEKVEEKAEASFESAWDKATAQ
ncbi:peroxin-3 [Stagonosporopsis vannaccii]|nr:peroxin-3 [Stagonosporopsis vannaccii]